MKKDRNVYLQMKTLEEARKILFEMFPEPKKVPCEWVSTPDAVGRVLGEPVFAQISSPDAHLAAMDGVAVEAEKTYGAGETSPKEFIIGKEAFYVNTGHVLPPGTNAVIMIEHVRETGEDRIEIEAPVFPFQHVRKVGEDIVATELLFPQNHRVTPYCVGALLSGGIFSVPVKPKPRVLIIPTGSELVDWRKVPLESVRPGQVLETNSFVLGKLIEEWGGTFVRHEMLEDDIGTIRKAVQDGIQGDFDIVLIGGGSSAGSEDYSRLVIADLGKVLVHGVTIMPGKPIVIGQVSGKPVFGVPGYSVSAIIAFEEFIGPLICRMLGQEERRRETVLVKPTRKITSKLGLEEFVRVKIGKVGDALVATPLPRGAGCITSLTEADGIIRIPNHVEGIKEQEPVRAELLRPLPALENTIVAVGSHDNTLDVLADRIKARYPAFSLSSSHVGSMGGLMAIKRGVCHVAGSHLLDPSDGSYNLSYIRRLLPEIPVRVVQLVFRDQGFILPKGNPKKVKGIKDLTRKDVVFINRQSGSGTRVLLDYRLQEQGIRSEQINGYATEEYTHMAVAVAVQSGAADVGLGIFSAAKALGLDFIPVVTEQYDLIIPQEHFESNKIRALLEIISSSEFKNRVESLGGYSTRRTGEYII
ncbi:MAG: molybdopterin biosynthesis protein [Desulfobacterales bacterium CG23_combo_of_CG06-09_8_20_14_all_52_9]|nr:MAG: molybdopterin biosynthesis protein [Desulfobacterales bacterium CG23_combo_of_CG06-09_8_20_14_all_52_9]